MTRMITLTLGQHLLSRSSLRKRTLISVTLMEKSLWTVGLGTITICKSVFISSQRISSQPNQILKLAATSAFVTGLYGIIRNTPRLGILVGTAAINSGITAGTFFSEPNQKKKNLAHFSYWPLGIREFGISPILTHVAPWKQFVHRRRELGIGNSLDDVPPSEKLFWSDLRTNRLFDSGMAGAITGGLLRGLKSMLSLTWSFMMLSLIARSTSRSACHCVRCNHS